MSKRKWALYSHNRIGDEMVKNILLIRHADAELQKEKRTDFERKLSERGKSEASLLGDHLKKLPFEIEVFYTSPSRRTLETCREAIQSLGYSPRVISSEEYYEATKNVMLAAISRVDGLFNNVAIVAHNPSITQLYNYLCPQSVGGFLTASCAWVQLEADKWEEVSGGLATLKEYYYPGMA